MASLVSLARALFAVLFDRPIRVSLPVGQGHFYPSQGFVLPVIAGGAPEGDGDGDGEDGSGVGEGDAEGSGDDDEGDDGDGAGDEGDGGGDGEEKDWRKELRRYERTIARKRERDKKELKEAQDKLKEVEDAKKSDTEKAIEKAKEEGRSEALTEAQKERRKDRLESAVTRAAAKKITIGEGDESKKLRFEDPEDAEVFLQRKIAKGDIDEEDLFDDDGKPKADVIAEALQEILEEKPRLAEDSGAQSGSGKTKTADGGADQGKGKSSGSGLEDMSVEDHVKRLAGKK